MMIEDMLGKKKMHFSLIDPDKQEPEKAGEIAKICEEYGSDAIMVGGSTVKKREMVHDTIKEIKKKCHLPTILFPNSAEAVASNADYIFFMDLLNSLEYKYRKGEQLKGAKLVKEWRIKPIPTGYLIISTSKNPTTVETKTKLDIIREDDVEKAVEYAMYAECIGLKCLYLEAGSNAEKPVPDEMIKAIKNKVSLPLIVGGGIKTPEMARKKIEAGADVIVNGSLVEENIEKLKEIIDVVKNWNS